MNQHGDGGPAGSGPTQLLGEDHRGDVAHPQTSVLFRDAEPEETQLPHLVEHIAGHRPLLLPGLDIGDDLSLHVFTHLVADRRQVVVYVDRSHREASAASRARPALLL